MEVKDSDTVNIIVREELPNNDNYGACEDSQPIDVNTYHSPFGNRFPKDSEYAEIVYDAECAIISGLSPILSEKGTSGCYFVHGRMGVCTCKTVKSFCHSVVKLCMPLSALNANYYSYRYMCKCTEVDL